MAFFGARVVSVVLSGKTQFTVKRLVQFNEMSHSSSPFTWTIKSPITSAFSGFRSEPDKVFDKIVPVQMQISSSEERKQTVRLTVELVHGSIASSSYRKVSNKLFLLLLLMFK